MIPIQGITNYNFILICFNYSNTGPLFQQPKRCKNQNLYYLCQIINNLNIDFYSNLTITIFQNYMEEGDRKDNRLLSSLIDLRLELFKSQPSLEEGKRKSKKLGALRAIYDNQIHQNFMEILQKKTANDKALILKSLKSHFTLTTLIEDRDLRQLLLQKFKLCKVMQGQYLMKQGSNASSFFILHEGKLSVQINGAVKRNIQPGEGFGQLALLYSAPRSASIKALKSSFLWFIDRQTFRNAISSMITKCYKQNRVFIDKNSFFKYLTPKQKDKLASIAINQRFQKNKQVCKQGELAASMYILKSGKLGIYKQNQFKGSILKGESFEEYTALSKNCVRRYTIKVSQDAQIMALGAQDIQNVLGKGLPLIILRNQALNALQHCRILQKLSDDYKEKIIDCFKLKTVKSGQTIVRKDDACRNLIFFIADGQYIISDASKRSLLYGESSLKDPTSTYKVDIKMKQVGKIAWTTYDEVAKSFGCSLEQAIKNSESLFKLIEKQKNNRNNQTQIAKGIKLEDILVLKKLGEGQFGHVFLVSDKSRQNVYALKSISKEETVKTKLERHVLNQKEALSLISSPFIMQFVRSYKDESYIYFLTEFINGIELFDAIRLIGLLNSEQTTFYAAQLLHILQSLHQKSILYRDLKPENVMVCTDGYLKLIDLGTCKKLNGTEKTFTMIGTPSYMAPQTLAGKGYSFHVDLWSLGVVIYQFMAGFVPFGEDAQDPLQIYQQILKNPLKFPKHMKDIKLNALITILLNKNPQSRLGGSFSSLKMNPVFENINWHDLISKKVSPPFLLPQDKILDLASLKNKAKPLREYLPVSKKSSFKNEGVSNWDSAF